jgi:D-amino-acid dehydrogenase
VPPDTSADIAVLGGGLVGAAVAYELACAGVGVALVDGDLPGRASDAGAGIISPETFHDPDHEWFEFGSHAARHLEALVARLEGDGPGPRADAYARCGSLVVALAEHEDPWFTEVLGYATARSSEVAEVPASEARAMFPPLGHVWRALHNPGAARVDGRHLRAMILAAARRRGATLVSLEATGVERHGDRVTAVVGRDGRVQCGALVLAGGAWSATAAHWLGTDLPVTPTKGQIVHVTLPEGDAATGAPGSDQWPIIQPVLNFYLVPWPGGRVACGGTFEAGAGFDTRATAAGLRDLLRECVAIAPGLADATFHEVRVGLRPTTTDDRPLLGPLPGTANVHVCTGHGANGLLLGPYSAALVSAGVVDDTGAGMLPYGVARLGGT